MVAKTDTAVPAGAPKPGSQKTGPLAFLRQVRQEAARITWPTRKETTVSAIMVFVMAAISAVFLFLADQVIAFLIQLILG